MHPLALSVNFLLWPLCSVANIGQNPEKLDAKADAVEDVHDT
jgi:hypothetical protein